MFLMLTTIFISGIKIKHGTEQALREPDHRMIIFGDMLGYIASVLYPAGRQPRPLKRNLDVSPGGR